MYTNQQLYAANPNPWAARLTLEHRQALDTIRARSVHRFGLDAYRMEADAGDGAATGEQASDTTTTDTGDAAASTTAQQTTQTTQQTAAEKVEDLPEWAQKLIKGARGEAAENRTKANAAEKKLTEQLDGIAKALGLKEDEKVDPETLKKELGETRSQARQSAIELAVYRSASKHQGDPDALLDSRGFLAKLTDLDPTASNFAAKVETAIKDAVKDNPKLQSGRAPGKGSADHGAGGSGEPTKRETKSLSDAVAGHYGT